MRSRTVFKVVRVRDDGTLASCSIQDGPGCVIYTPGQPATGPVGPILAFKRRPDADVFCGGIYRAVQVWRAVATGVRNVPYLCGPMRPDLFADFWREVASGEIPRYAGLPPPPGTVACDEITLVERVL